MRTLLFAICVSCATAAFGQTAPVLPNRPAPVVMTENPLHASQHEMAPEQDIFEHSDYAYAKGERPLYEFGPVSQPEPLGDIARSLRKEHEAVKKSEFVWEKVN